MHQYCNMKCSPKSRLLYFWPLILKKSSPKKWCKISANVIFYCLHDFVRTEEGRNFCRQNYSKLLLKSELWFRWQGKYWTNKYCILLTNSWMKIKYRLRKSLQWHPDGVAFSCIRNEWCYMCYIFSLSIPPSWQRYRRIQLNIVWPFRQYC